MIRARRAMYGADRERRVQSSSLLVGQDHRNLGAFRSHARFLIKEYERAAPPVFTFYACRTRA